MRYALSHLVSASLCILVALALRPFNVVNVIAGIAGGFQFAIGLACLFVSISKVDQT